MTSQTPNYHGLSVPARDHRPRRLTLPSLLSQRDAEDLLAQRGVTVTYETIRHWCRTFGPAYARRLRHRRGRLGDTWYLDELFVNIQGRRQYLWRAVDQDGDVIDILVQSRCDRCAATRFFRKLLKGPRPRATAPDHRQAPQLRGGAPHRDAIRGAQYPAVREQSSGGVSPVDPPARAPDATVQVGRTRATLLVGARSRAEPLSCGAPPAPSCAPPSTENALVLCLGCGDVCLLNDDGNRVIEGSARPLLVNLTVPS